jgi:hypothetical protein
MFGLILILLAAFTVYLVYNRIAKPSQLTVQHQYLMNKSGQERLQVHRLSLVGRCVNGPAPRLWDVPYQRIHREWVLCQMWTYLFAKSRTDEIRLCYQHSSYGWVLVGMPLSPAASRFFGCILVSFIFVSERDDFVGTIFNISKFAGSLVFFIHIHPSPCSLEFPLAIHI